MDEKTKELLRAARQSLNYLDHDDCDYGINGPSGDVCTCRVQSVIRRLSNAIEAFQ